MNELEQYESLNKILSVNEELKETLIDKGWTDDQSLMLELDELFSELSECEGLEEKISKLSSDTLNKFKSLWSELRFAKIFKDEGKSVEFFSQGCMGYKNSEDERKSPDLYVRNKEDAYVEVKRLEDIDSKKRKEFEEDLEEFLPEEGYKVSVNLGGDLSPAVASAVETGKISEIEKRWKGVLEKFKKKFRDLDFSQGSVIISGEEKFEVFYESQLSSLEEKSLMRSKGTTFEIQRTPNDRTNAEVRPKGAFKGGGEDYEKKIKEKLIEAAEERDDWWDEKDKDGLYLIAIFIGNYYFGEDWGDFINDMYKSEEEIMSNVSGVLILTLNLPLEYYIIRNPFAEGEISEPKLESYFG